MSLCAGDCDGGDGSTFPGAPETNDGLDNQCSGDVGFGLIDEISGLARFVDAGTLCWDAQGAAQAYEIVRSDVPEGSVDCVRQFTASACWFDPEDPELGQGFHYLARAAFPFLGSWGRGADGGERAGLCIAP